MSIQFREATLAEDIIIARHFYQLWQDLNVSIDDINNDWMNITLKFIEESRRDLYYQAFIAEVNDCVVGSVSCQLFSGLYPQILSERSRKYGYIWGVYIEASHRRQGIAAKLTSIAIEYLKSLDCTDAILHASPLGKSVYESLHFIPSNEMRLKLSVVEQN